MNDPRDGEPQQCVPGDDQPQDCVSREAARFVGELQHALFEPHISRSGND